MVQQFFGFQGRAGRGTWWFGVLLAPFAIYFLAGLLASIFAAIDTALSTSAFSVLSVLAVTLAVLAPFVIYVCVTVKRYHDRGKSGWWFWLWLLPVIGPIWQLIELGFCSGDDSDNVYGPPPGSVARRDSLNREVQGMSSDRLVKLDDDYLANYAKNMATQQTATASSFGQNNNGRPAFGKR